jgi:hypothetical protein
MAPGVRFLALGARCAEVRNGGVVTRRDTEHEPTVAFLRAVPQAPIGPRWIERSAPRTCTPNS